MLAVRSEPRIGASRVTLGLVSTFPPSRCGIARFTVALADALSRVSTGVQIDVVRIIDDASSPSAIGRVAMEFDPNSSVSLRAAARHLEGCDVVLVQHEYGIFGAHDGVAVLELLGMTGVPVVTVLHTVRREPSSRQRQIIEHLAVRGHLVVPSRSARSVLTDTYGLPASRVDVIPHGSHWSALPTGPPPHRRLITWGLLGPGKGVERAIRAVAMLDDLHPPVHYRIVGQTHPTVFRAEGPAYRRRLQRLAEDLGVSDRVEFVARYLEDDDLSSLVAESDVVVVPYDNGEQISSGVISDAVAAGRPVVATRFPHAVELLDDGPGITVPHDDGVHLAGALRELLTDERRFDAAARAAASKSVDLSWDSVARSYWDLLRRLTSQLASA